MNKYLILIAWNILTLKMEITRRISEEMKEKENSAIAEVVLGNLLSIAMVVVGGIVRM